MGSSWSLWFGICLLSLLFIYLWINIGTLLCLQFSAVCYWLSGLGLYAGVCLWYFLCAIWLTVIQKFLIPSVLLDEILMHNRNSPVMENCGKIAMSFYVLGFVKLICVEFALPSILVVLFYWGLTALHLASCYLLMLSWRLMKRIADICICCLESLLLWPAKLSNCCCFVGWEHELFLLF